MSTLEINKRYSFAGSHANLIMQEDGNLVIYDRIGRPVWETGTGGNHGATAIFQTDGNLVIYHHG